MKKSDLIKSFFLAAAAGGIALSAHAQVFVDEDFEGGLGNWTAGNGVLDTEFGNPGASLQHPGGSASIWNGPGFALNPADGAIVLTADVYDDGTAGTNTVGLRGGPFPLFEMGHYAYDQSATGGGNDNYKVRIANFAGNENWVGLTGGAIAVGEGPAGWNRWQATFTETGVSISLDIGITGTVDYSYVSEGTTEGNFTTLRLGGPSNLSTANSSAHYDNVSLEVIPEPSTYAAIFGGLALLGAFVYRRRLSAKK